MARPILRKVGQIIFGRIRNRIRGEGSPPLFPIEITRDNSGPAVTKQWEPPPWLAPLIKLIVLIIEAWKNRQR